MGPSDLAATVATPNPPNMSLTYSMYLKLDELLALQKPRPGGPEHDEMLFIIIHQVYELWFKEVLHELDFLGRLFQEHSRDYHTTPRALDTLKRILTIFKTMVAQVDILETMTPISFSSFRARLEEASGFQSPQFRELEFVLGHRDRGMLRHHAGNDAALRQLERRLEEPSIYQRFLGYVRRIGYEIPAAASETRDVPPEGPEIRDALIRIYREDDRLTQVCERMVDLDEGLQEWRYRHVKMVERTIGGKSGTGGSPGAAYLRTTLFKPVFPDLWTIRSDF